MKRLVRAIGDAIEWLDAIVLVLILAGGTALMVVVIVGDAGAVQVGLVALGALAVAFRWARTSFALDKLRGHADRGDSGGESSGQP